MTISEIQMPGPTAGIFHDYATTRPCPSFCQYERNHPFEGSRSDGRQWRFHDRHLPAAEGVELTIIQREERQDDDDATARLRPARAVLKVDRDFSSPSDIRELA